jgi:hypothetical protein
MYIQGSKLIRSELVGQETSRHLSACKKNVGWPVQRIIDSLRKGTAGGSEEGLSLGNDN